MNWPNAAWVMEWSFAVFLVVLEFLILWLIWQGARSDRGINLAKLVSEKDGTASLSRFQALLFTFVVVGVFAMRAFDSAKTKITDAATGTVTETWTWPIIDENTLYLLAGSGATYLTSKAIQKNSEGKEGAGGADQTVPTGRFAR